MKFFWPIYLLTGVVGTAGLYVAAPLARPYVAAVFGKRSVAPTEAQGNGSSGELRLKTEASSSARESESPDPIGSAAPAVADAGDEVSPARNGIVLATRTDKPTWGITSQRTTTFGLDGTRLGHVSGGILLEYRSARVSSIGNMVESVLLENGTPSAPRLISKKDVYLFTGSYTRLSAKQRADLLAYYTLSGKIAQRKNELLLASAEKNPYFSAYSQAYKAYSEQIEVAKVLTRKRDHATELDKARLEDQLREMKVATTALRNEYDATHEKFRVWKDQHTNEIAKAENDPDVLKWTLEMNALSASIPGLAY
jgi:hypothetical protein